MLLMGPFWLLVERAASALFSWEMLLVVLLLLLLFDGLRKQDWEGSLVARPVGSLQKLKATSDLRVSESKHEGGCDVIQYNRRKQSATRCFYRGVGASWR
jgi:hypothetical protein